MLSMQRYGVQPLVRAKIYMPPGAKNKGASLGTALTLHLAVNYMIGSVFTITSARGLTVPILQTGKERLPAMQTLAQVTQ